MAHQVQGLTIFEAPLLKERTSIRLGGPAIAEIRVSSAAGLEQLPETALRVGGSGVRIEPFSAGTNVLARDQELPLVLITQDVWQETRVVGQAQDRVLLKADAAQKLPALLAKAASLGLGGLEGLTGIPGSVGGAVAMNAGSYGVCIGDLVHSVEVFSPVLGLTEIPACGFVFSYRSCRWVGPSAPSTGDGWFLITGVTLALPKSERNLIRERMRAVYAKKRATQPVAARSAGCVFKNPSPEHPAGRLLEQAGLKGMNRGGMRFSTVHANFLVNEGAGESMDAMYLIELAKDRVHRESGHLLETEVRVWP
jgi:UDP-N-acetylmuramate dehydrogenase